MEVSRRNLAVAGVLAFGAARLIGPALAQSGDEAAVKHAVEEMRSAYLKKDKAEFIKGVMDRKADVKSLEYPDLTIHITGDVAIVRHLWVSESELEGKTTHTKIGVMQVWHKQSGDGWKLLARSSYRLPQAA
jgi:hypothetical protein